jgi:phosphatidylethanolamine/phosphatidyl-N-methylethanolamine N-methyltransferase|tara:strand:+ start:228 stop:899 length:672 start_codon:yes stop_codon:yes gene_type:complete
MFDRKSTREYIAADPSTRALSVAAVETSSYDNIASVYDWTYGPALHAGRLASIKKLRLRPGDEVLEVGVGTGLNAALYPRFVSVTGIDVAEEMLEKAEQRLAARDVRNVRLVQMDAARLDFPDNSFDLVYAPYVINVVPDPVAVATEMHRVCRPGGCFVILNHFLSSNRFAAWVERLISPLTVHAGFKSDVDLSAFLAQAHLCPLSIEKVGVLPIWTLITCEK